MLDIDEAITNVRRITTSLRHPLLDDFGLEAALNSQARDYTNMYGLQINMEIHIDGIHLSDDRKITFFRIFQESMTNVTKHAKATKVDILFHVVGRKIEMVISDNGIGYDENNISHDKMMGILGMRERINAFGGEFRIIGTPGQGTQVSVLIPLI